MAHPIVGDWRIVEMDLWDRDAIELLGIAVLHLGVDGTGRFCFIAVEVRIDWKPAEGTNDRAEFTWEGNDEGDPASGRG